MNLPRLCRSLCGTALPFRMIRPLKPGARELFGGAAALRSVGVDVGGSAGGPAMPETHILNETFF